MITLDSSKYKPHDNDEALWLASTHEKISNAIIAYHLPITYIRVGRQVKAYGSRGVSSYKCEWRESAANTGVWINGHHRGNIDIDKIIAFMVKSSITWKPLASQMKEEDTLFLKLKFGL